jgi:hypothetical protein
MKGRKSPEMVRRPSSSAETSIDEDTADQLFADDFIVPATMAASRPGASAYYSRSSPTSPYDFERRTPSVTSSSQGRTLVNPQYSRNRGSQFSMSTTERDSYPPSVTVPLATPALPTASNYSLPDSLEEANADPFRDPPEITDATPDIAPREVPTLAPIPVISEKRPSFNPQTADNAPPGKAPRKRRAIVCIIIAIVLVILVAVLVPVGLLVIKPKSSNNSSAPASTSSSSTPGLTKPDGRSPSSLGIPDSAIGTVLDSTKWLDWTDFNVTYTNATVGGLSLMVEGYYKSADDRD